MTLWSSSSRRVFFFVASVWVPVGACALDRSGGQEVPGEPPGPAGTGGTTTTGGGAGTTTAAGAGGTTACVGPDDCAGPTCVDPAAGLLRPAQSCDDGICSSEMPAPCPDGYRCAGSACLTSCTDSSECVDTHYCDGSACVARLPPGSPCPQGNECTDTCVDGICCDTACTDTCSSCFAADTGAADGTCAPITAWTDPNAECTGGDELACNGASACASCGDDVMAPGGAQPPICDAIDVGKNACTIVADAGEFNANNPLVCPPDWHCIIDCSADDSCRATTITCPTDYSCNITCPTNDECRDSVIQCPTNGTCTVTCGDDGCEDATIQCGANACAVDCIDGENNPPEIVQGGACSLTEDCP